jgi:CHASE2 domain-containing sensor protein
MACKLKCVSHAKPVKAVAVNGASAVGVDVVSALSAVKHAQRLAATPPKA